MDKKNRKAKKQNESGYYNVGYTYAREWFAFGRKKCEIWVFEEQKKKKKWAIGIERGMTIGNKHFEELI